MMELGEIKEVTELKLHIMCGIGVLVGCLKTTMKSIPAILLANWDS